MKRIHKKVRIGIVGCGAIGATLSLLIKKYHAAKFEVAALYDCDVVKMQSLKKRLKISKGDTLAELIDSCDLVVEAASAQASLDIAQKALTKGKDVLIMSVGGVLGKEKRLFAVAKKHNRRIYFPSGAICGLDGISSLSLAGFKKIVLKTFKSPAALKGADYIVQKNIDLEKIKKETVIFRGTAFEAVKAFPQNINIVALLSIAARGRIIPEVEIAVSPGLKRNVHHIEVHSDAACLTINCENVPSPDNPKTSYLAILSALAAINGIGEVFHIGA